MSAKRGRKRTINELKQDNNDTLPTPNSKRRRQNGKNVKKSNNIDEQKQSASSKQRKQDAYYNYHHNRNHVPPNTSYHQQHYPNQNVTYAPDETQYYDIDTAYYSTPAYSQYKSQQIKNQHNRDVSHRYEPHISQITPTTEPKNPLQLGTQTVMPTKYKLNSNQRAFAVETDNIFLDICCCIFIGTSGIIAVLYYEYNIFATTILALTAMLRIICLGENKFIVFDEVNDEIILLTEYLWRNALHTKYICSFSGLISIYSIECEHTYMHRSRKKRTKTYKIKVKYRTGNKVITEVNYKGRDCMDDLEEFFSYYYPQKLILIDFFQYKHEKYLVNTSNGTICDGSW